ncbi:MAG: DEAD/DEAH box helicase [bacterium]|nr:DEAD/DEAH box helicase [bacterium]
MKLRYLEAFNIPQEIISLWEQKYSDKLLPIQELAVKQYHVLDGESLLVFSPTSSGKTFIAELAAVKQALEKKKVIFAVPLKSLAEEKFRQFQNVYTLFGLRTVIATRDRIEFDRSIEEYHFEIAVMVYEKVNSLLIKHPKFLDHIGLLVIDELQMLGDESRGVELDLLLTKIIFDRQKNRKNLQLLGLSAVLGDIEQLARWLAIPVLTHAERPVELRKGILYNGIFEYQEHNSKQNGEEIFFAPETGNQRAILRTKQSVHNGLIHHTPTSPSIDGDPYNTDQILSLVQYLAEVKHESSVVFVPKKSLTRLWANILADRVKLDPALTALSAMNEFEDSLVKEELCRLLNRAIAYHNADLDIEFRQIIETYFRSGEIRIVIATSTLGQGVNLKAKNAIIVPHTLCYHRQEKTVTPTMMSKSQFENFAGRVGRFGIESEFGRAILVAGNEHQRLSYWLWYIERPFEKLAPHFLQENLEMLCLNLICSGWCKTVRELTDFICRMYRSFGIIERRDRVFLSDHSDNITAFQPGTTVELNSDVPLGNSITQSIDVAQQWGLITTSARNELEATAIGQATASAGITFDTTRHFLNWLQQVDSWHISELEILLVSALTPDASHLLFPITKNEIRTGMYQTELMKLIFELGTEPRLFLKHILNQSLLPMQTKLLAMKKTLVLYHWINEIPTPDLERRYRVYFGAIKNLAEEFAWLVQAVSGLAQSLGLPNESIAIMHPLILRLRYGVKTESLPLIQLNIPGLGRMRVACLVREGYSTPEAIAELTLDQLSNLVTQPVAERLQRRIADLLPPRVTVPSADTHVQHTLEYDTLELLGIPERKRTLLRINNQAVGLRNRDYLILLKLALAGQKGIKWTHKDELDNPDNVSRYLSRLRCALRRFQKHKKYKLIDNDLQGYYRLNLPPENVVIHFDNFSQHWHHEFREIIQQWQR